MEELEKVLLAICSKVPQKELIEVTKMIALPWGQRELVSPRTPGWPVRRNITGKILCSARTPEAMTAADQSLKEQGYKLL